MATKNEIHVLVEDRRGWRPFVVWQKDGHLNEASNRFPIEKDLFFDGEMTFFCVSPLMTDSVIVVAYQEANSSHRNPFPRSSFIDLMIFFFFSLFF